MLLATLEVPLRSSSASIGTKFCLGNFFAKLLQDQCACGDSATGGQLSPVDSRDGAVLPVPAPYSGSFPGADGAT